MEKENIVSAFAGLGKFLGQFGPGERHRDDAIAGNDLFFEPMKMLVDRAVEVNPWFTPQNVAKAFAYWADALQADKIRRWLDAYGWPEGGKSRCVGVVTAGNIPLVGLHDVLSVLAAGHKARVKMSSSDNRFLPLIVKFLAHQYPAFGNRIEFTDGLLRGCEAYIATGSDNTARYFEYYFGSYPSIIRRNRNGVAVLTGDETDRELLALADDVMLYFGLGCRNVSKLFVPEGYDLNRIFSALTASYAHYAGYRKYKNNYDYNKAVFLMSIDDAERHGLLDNGLVLMKRDHRYASPIGVLFYEIYRDPGEVKKILAHDRDKIQVIVGHIDLPGVVPFGQSQKPELWDYADGVDTMRFLLNLYQKN